MKPGWKAVRREKEGKCVFKKTWLLQSEKHKQGKTETIER